MLPPIFIVGASKAGTTLLQSLLDGHPELFVLPLEIKFFKFPALPSLPPGNMPPYPAPCWKTPVPREAVSPDQLKHEILQHADFGDLAMKKSLDRNISIDELGVDIDRFFRVIRERKFSSLKELYLGFFEAFYEAWKGEGDVHRFRLVEKSPSEEEYAQELKAWFPEAVFLHVLRNPYANLYSSAKISVTKGSLHHIYKLKEKSYYFMERNKRYVANYHIIKYEDIVTSTKETMHKIADILEIGFNESLLHPTICGVSWHGNPRSTKSSFDGISKKPLTIYKKKITALEVALVNRYFSYFLEKYDYEKLSDQELGKWLPIKWETPLSYVRNRAMLVNKFL